MKIAFIVSSAEPGKCGMGDYALSLARALTKLGHSILIVAVNDRWLSEPSDASSATNDAGVVVERLPACLPWDERIDRACARLRAFAPDWASFQLVCYSYHPKGILFSFNQYLRRLAGVCENWQVMFQELWIGFAEGSSLKHRIVGSLQRHSIAGSVRALRPKLLQTSTPLFRALLGTLGLDASVLPMAGAIPVNPDPGRDWFLQTLDGIRLPSSSDPREGCLVGGFFGTIYEGWKPEPFFSSLRSAAEKTGQTVCILSAGRIGADGDAIWNGLVAAYPQFHFLKLGELSASRISQYFQNLDFGIAGSPWVLIGKSSASTAMLDHGLPVMVPRNDSRPRMALQIDPPKDPLLILADQDISHRFLSRLPRRAPRHSVEDLAAEFIRQIHIIQPISPARATSNGA